MAYASVRGRKPIERASKIAHAEVISNPKVRAFLAGCSVPISADPTSVVPLLTPVPAPAIKKIKAVVAIDGGFTEVPIRQEYPSATVTFFTFGPLLLNLADLTALDAEPFIAPEDLVRLKRIQRYSLVLPTKNVSLNGKSLVRSVRDTIQEFFLERPSQDPPFMSALRWLLFREWDKGATRAWLIPRCPNLGCSHTDIELTTASADETTCGACGGPIYIVDALRLHERVDEDQGASGILSYVMTTVEQICLVHVIKAIWEMSPRTLTDGLHPK